ncbi:MAG: ribose 5-phosphate isomerase [Gammaproteobacteria bacterium]|jgi:ribose 5-phosphate isomerase A|nr:ribose 5-phosphate isomerase [Gammaproteobacteria bacterium]
MTSPKQQCAEKALDYLKDGMVLGVGTGSTTEAFIALLEPWRNRLEAVVASSIATAEKLKALKMPLVELNEVGKIDLYVDGADEINDHLQMIKGGGAAMTREKILAAASQQFICIAEKSKHVDLLAKKAPVPVEVIPMARSFVAREIVKLGGQPEYRIGVKTDNGNAILDCYYLDCIDPLALEQTLSMIPGVVGNGVFAKRRADRWLHE